MRGFLFSKYLPTSPGDVIMQQFKRLGGVLQRTVCAIACLWATVPPAATAQGLRSSRATEPEEVKMNTKDGVRLAATYYPSSMQRAVPVVMLHDYKESRAVFHALARMLQDPQDPGLNSHAIVTVDLRGHGESTSTKGGGEIEAARLKTPDFRDMVLYDMEAVRKFLVTKNDAGELNLNKLCLVGSGLGANVAICWAAVDWNTPELPRIKQGQDVKGLFLASPSWGAHGLLLKKPLREPGVQRQISMFLVYGEGSQKEKKDVKTIHKNVEKYRAKPKRGEMPGLIVWPLDTERQGTPLLVDPRFKIVSHLNRFIQARLTDQDYDWLRRRSAK